MAGLQLEILNVGGAKVTFVQMCVGTEKQLTIFGGVMVLILKVH